MSKHENYDVLNLFGYGLAKFNRQFITAMGFSSKTALYNLLVSCGVAETPSVVKNRQDLFDPFFDNGRRGWWQKGDAYIHRKLYIDSLFGTLDAAAYANVVKLQLNQGFGAGLAAEASISPILKSRFKQLQQTGLEAEEYFVSHYQTLSRFESGSLEDARLLGDGYDFQVTVKTSYFLAEIKGVRGVAGGIRMTEKEYHTALEYKDLYALIVISNLSDAPKMTFIENPANQLRFSDKTVTSLQTTYHLPSKRW